MNSYELMIIHRPEMAEADVQSDVGQLTAAITEAESGSVTGTDFWGRRRFAYEINHIHEGYYTVVDFQADAGVVDFVDRALGLSDAVIRHKIMRKDAA